MNMRFFGDVLSEDRRVLFAILLAAAMIRLALAAAAPAWESPDEYPHFWYAEQIAETGELPVWQRVFPSYEAYQPPLYYVLIAGIVRLAGPFPDFIGFFQPPGYSLIAVRLFSVLCGLLTVWFTYLLAARAGGLDRNVRLTAAAVAAFLPTFAGVTSSANNDALAVLLCAASLATAFRKEWSTSTAVVVGLTFGLGVLTKLSALLIGPMLVYRLLTGPHAVSGGSSRSRCRFAGVALLAFLPGIALLLWRNLAVYDSLLAVKPGVESDWSFSAAQFVWAVRNLTWSFWLAFGRTYQITLSPVVYILAILPLSLGAAVGLARVPGTHRRLIIAGIAAIFLTAFVSVAYTLSAAPGELTSWGKNLFPLLPVIALILALGWRYLTPRPSSIVPKAAVLLLVVGDLYALWKLMELWGCA